MTYCQASSAEQGTGQVQTYSEKLLVDTHGAASTSTVSPAVVNPAVINIPFSQYTVPREHPTSCTSEAPQPLSAHSEGDTHYQDARTSTPFLAPAIMQMHTASIYGDQGWYLERQPPQTTSVPYSPYLDPRSNFPSRPLLPGTLAQLHNDWLLAFGQGDGQRPDPLVTRGLPTPEQTYESSRLRMIWQEIDRRRSVDIGQAEMEVVMLAKNKAYNELRSALYANGTPREPTYEEVARKAKETWERSKVALLYCSALLRQAEFALAQGSLALRPPEQNQAPLPRPQQDLSHEEDAEGISGTAKFQQAAGHQRAPQQQSQRPEATTYGNAPQEHPQQQLQQQQHRSRSSSSQEENGFKELKETAMTPPPTTTSLNHPSHSINTCTGYRS